MGETLTHLDQDREQLRHELVTQQEALMLQQTQMAELIDQQGREFKTMFEQHVSEHVRNKMESCHVHQGCQRKNRELVYQTKYYN